MPNKTTLSQHVAELINAGLDAATAVEVARGLVDERETHAVNRNSRDDRYTPVFPSTDDDRDDSDDDRQPARRRRSRRYAPRVVYQLAAMGRALAKGKGTKAERAVVEQLTPSQANCLKVISKSKTPLSNRDIARLSGEGNKNVESVVYNLRHAGLIESVDVEK